MPTKKSIWVLCGISLVIPVWIFGSVVQAGAETMKCKTAVTATSDERMPVADVEHVLMLQKFHGLAFCENGEIAKVRSHAIADMSQKGGQAIAYMIFTFADGATIVVRNQRLMTADKPETLSAQMPGEIIKGTGRFEGIKGTTSATGKNFVKTETEPTRIANDVAFTYTLPGK